jgi:acyl-CoA reductase-like NAD-dependent aldehyde dehydrogenase
VSTIEHWIGGSLTSGAAYLAGLWRQADLPDGVFNVVHGDKVAVDALLDHPRRAEDLP